VASTNNVICFLAGQDNAGTYAALTGGAATVDTVSAGAAVASATPTVLFDQPITVTRSAAMGHLCWTTGATTPATATCGPAGIATAFGDAGDTVVCGGNSTSTAEVITWDVVTEVTLSIIECAAESPYTALGDAFAITAITQGAATIESVTTTSIAAGATSTITFVTKGLHSAAEGARFFKIVPNSDNDCTTAAITGLEGQLTVVSPTSGTFSATLGAAIAVQSGAKVCQSNLLAGTYSSVTASGTAADDFIDITAAVSTATVTSTTTTTISAHAATTVAFVTTNLLLAATDLLFVKLVPSSSTCAAAPGILDSINGGACEVVRDGTDVVTAGQCSIVITTDLSSAGNIWCYSAGADNSGAYVAFTGATVTAITTSLAWGSAIPTAPGGLFVGSTPSSIVFTVTPSAPVAIGDTFVFTDDSTAGIWASASTSAATCSCRGFANTVVDITGAATSGAAPPINIITITMGAASAGKQELIFTCSGNLAVNVAAAVTFTASSTSNVGALTGQVGYTVVLASTATVS